MEAVRYGIVFFLGWQDRLEEARQSRRGQRLLQRHWKLDSISSGNIAGKKFFLFSFP